jgi:hypothetical protein
MHEFPLCTLLSLHSESVFLATFTSRRNQLNWHSYEHADAAEHQAGKCA